MMVLVAVKSTKHARDVSLMRDWAEEKAREIVAKFHGANVHNWDHWIAAALRETEAREREECAKEIDEWSRNEASAALQARESSARAASRLLESSRLLANLAAAIRARGT